MSWLEENATAIANRIWRGLPDEGPESELCIHVAERVGGCVGFRFSRPESVPSNHVYIDENSLIAKTEDVDMIVELIMYVAGAQATAYRQGVESHGS